MTPDDLPNGRELRERLTRIEERLADVVDRVTVIERSRHAIVAWLAGISAGVVTALIIAALAH